MRECDIVNALIDIDPTLKATYDIYQDLLTAIKMQSSDKLSVILDKDHPEISSYMKTALKTLREHRKHIINSFTHPYTNGKLEGTNNLIKVIKRIAFGYRTFHHFKIRVLVISNDLTKRKEQELRSERKKTRDIHVSLA